MNQDKYKDIAVCAVSEGYWILSQLAERDERKDNQWLTNSIALDNLNRLARELGYRDAKACLYGEESDGN